MIGLLNLGSLMVGLIAWILPLVSLMKYENHNNRQSAAFSIMSLSACAISLIFQIFYNYHLVIIEDWSALMDTMGAVVIASAVLLVVTLILNAINLVVYRERTT